MMRKPAFVLGGMVFLLTILIGFTYLFPEINFSTSVITTMIASFVNLLILLWLSVKKEK